MKRSILKHLQDWKNSSRRKPLLIRGARQVGKTTIVRLFAKDTFDDFAEFNMETHIELGRVIKAGKAKEWLSELELECGKEIVPGKTLLFLDEIQACPNAIELLRYFYEDLPELHVIAAGSLLEFAMADPKLSMPVGRIEMAHLGPMSFTEFLEAAEETSLLKAMRGFQWGDTWSPTLHRKLMQHCREFCFCGGMPASVSAWLENGPLASEREKLSILDTFRDDIAHYRGRVDGDRVTRIFDHIPNAIGAKLKYRNIDPNDSARNLSRALDLLCLAKVVHKVEHSDGTGLPLRSTVRPKMFKPLFIDIGLMLTAMGWKNRDIQDNTLLAKEGALAEQFIGQQLLYLHGEEHRPELFYWAREKAGSAAEVDYLYAQGSLIAPIEVKAGGTGALKSLQSFLVQRNRHLGIRFNAEKPENHNASFSIPGTTRTHYRLWSLPLPMVEMIPRLIENDLSQHE